MVLVLRRYFDLLFDERAVQDAAATKRFG